MNRELSSFAARLRSLRMTTRDGMAQTCNPETKFNSLARELFALQFAYNPVYHKICEARGLTPKVVGHWTQIPFVPSAAFKELELTSLAPRERTTVFHSSGTTEQKPSRHFHNAESLTIYEASLLKSFQFYFKNAGECIFLTPDPSVAPHSSLIHMFETVRNFFGLPESAFAGKISADGLWTMDFNAVINKIMSACDSASPLTLLGTAFSFVHLLDLLAENKLRFQLPANSRVMETGGYKNRSRSLPKTELHALISGHLGVPRENIVCEYGMSELSSQAYAEGGGKFKFPAWARAQIVSSETGREVADGETGLIRVFDLANVFSVAAVQTEDLAIRRGDGFELIGRVQLAEPRGCSLMAAL